MSSLTEEIKQSYGSIATEVSQTCASGSSTCCKSPGPNKGAITRELYSTSEASYLPKKAVQASLGCGNPTATVEILPGQRVLDLGCGNQSFAITLIIGGGIDCLLSAKLVGPTGKVYGLDMTEEMILLARKNAEDASVTNVEFLLGSIDSIPLPDDSIDIIISNCVINLATDKDIVLLETYRVLKKGGKLAVSDIIFLKEPAKSVRKNQQLWAACIAGALTVEEYKNKLHHAGFSMTTIEQVRLYSDSDVYSLTPRKLMRSRSKKCRMGMEDVARHRKDSSKFKIWLEML